MGAARKGPTINTEDYRHVSSIRDNCTDAERDSREKFIGHVLGKLPSLCILSMKERTERKEKERGWKEEERGREGRRKQSNCDGSPRYCEYEWQMTIFCAIMIVKIIHRKNITMNMDSLIRKEWNSPGYTWQLKKKWQSRDTKGREQQWKAVIKRTFHFPGVDQNHADRRKNSGRQMSHIHL